LLDAILCEPRHYHRVILHWIRQTCDCNITITNSLHFENSAFASDLIECSIYDLEQRENLTFVREGNKRVHCWFNMARKRGLPSSSKSSFTWDGSRVELQAVKPDISANMTVVATNKSAIGFVWSKSLLSTPSERKFLKRLLFPPSYKLPPLFSPENNLSWTLDGKIEDTNARDRRTSTGETSVLSLPHKKYRQEARE
jgi:hypothetical protein